MSSPHPDTNRPISQGLNRYLLLSPPPRSVLMVAWLQAMPARSCRSAAASAAGWEPAEPLVSPGSTERLRDTANTVSPLPSCGGAGCRQGAYSGFQHLQSCPSLQRGGKGSGCGLIWIQGLGKFTPAFGTALKPAREAGCSAKQDPAGAEVPPSSASLAQGPVSIPGVAFAHQPCR